MKSTGWSSRGWPRAGSEGLRAGMRRTGMQEEIRRHMSELRSMGMAFMALIWSKRGKTFHLAGLIPARWLEIPNG